MNEKTPVLPTSGVFGGPPKTTGQRPVLPGVPSALAALFALAFTAFAQPDRDDPAAELASFKMANGFEANLFASEKDGVIKPIQIRWDTHGRLWVIQSTTYPQLVPGEEPNDKVLILEDTDSDGRADKTTVFADGLMIPTGLEVAPVGAVIGDQSSVIGGRADAPSPPITDHRSPITFPSAAYIGEGTKLWLMTDTDGDGRADKREVVLRGFGTGDNHQNINSFRWSPGGELFFSQGLHAFSRIETPHGIVPLDEAGFWRYRPREQRLDSFYGGPADPQNPWGFVWTDWGQMLMVAGNNGGIYWPLPEMIRGHRYGKRDQIWVNARGRKTSGPDIVGTAHLPDEWQGRFITGGYINNAVWTMAIEDDGAGFKLTDREPLITSTHGSFRPVDVKLGPDGAIYICDWYNPIIGHYQASFRHPDRDKAHGRIWRVMYKDRPLVKPPPIAGAPLGELLENLKSGERWVREQTKRELAGRRTDEVVKGLREWWRKLDGERAARLTAENAKDAEGRREKNKPESRNPSASYAVLDPVEHALVEALGVFESHNVMEEELIYRLAVSPNRNASAFAITAMGRWLPQIQSFGSFYPLIHPARLGSERVRLAAIVAAANLPTDRAVGLVVAAASFEPRDKSVELAARAAIATLKPQIDKLTDQDTAQWTPEGRERLAELQRPPAPTKPARSTESAPVKITAVPATGKLRATPEFVAELVREVKESGDASHGADVYRRAELACTSCHSIGDGGGKIGPPLDNIGSGQPLDFIIGATLEPQREIKESYEAMQFTEKDGRVAVGYVVARDPASTTIREPATGAETKFAAADVAEQKNLGSFMPAGLVDQLSREDLRDLFRYLSELGKPR